MSSTLVKKEHIANRKKPLSFIAIIAIFAFLFSPLPGVDAVTMSLSNTSTFVNVDNTTSDTQINFSINVKNAADNGVVFPEGGSVETVSSDSILRVVLNPDNPAIETVALFDLLGNRLDPSLLQSGQTGDTTKITSLIFNGVTRDSDGQYGYFDYGYFYGYGYRYLASTGYGYGTIGNGTYGYGLSANEFSSNTSATYTLGVNPDQLTNGANSIRVDILAASTSTDFFTTGVATFGNTITGTPTTSTVPSGGAGTSYVPDSTLTTLGITSSSLPATISATNGQSLDFTSAPSFVIAGDGTKSVTLSDTDSTVSASVGGLSIAVDFPAGVVVSGPAGWDGAVDVPSTAAGVAAPTGFNAGVVFSVGDGDIRLTFDKAVKLTIPGETGKQVFFSGGLSIGGVGSETLPECTFVNSQAGADAGLTVGGTEACWFDNLADLIVWTKHFSSFGSSTSSGGGAAGGGAAGGTSGGGGSGSGSGGGSGGASSALVSAVSLYEVSWDTCESNMIQIVAGPAEGNLNVKLRSPTAGVYNAVLAEDQYLNGRMIFEAALDPKDTFIFVQVEGIESRGATIAQKSINLGTCSGSYTVSEYVQPTTPVSVVKPYVDPFKAPVLEGATEFTGEHVGVPISVSYKTTDSGEIIAMSVNEDEKSVTFDLNNVTGGQFIISIPRGLVDANGDKFIVMVTASPEEQVDYTIIDSTPEYVTIQLELPQGATSLTIIGTHVVPEFGTIAMLVLIIPIFAVIALSRRTTLIPRI